MRYGSAVKRDAQNAQLGKLLAEGMSIRGAAAIVGISYSAAQVYAARSGHESGYGFLPSCEKCRITERCRASIRAGGPLADPRCERCDAPEALQ